MKRITRALQHPGAQAPGNRGRPLIKQRTLKNVIRATGVGLHTGCRVEMTLRPAAPDTGIVFRRVDLDPAVEVPATAAAVADTRLSTTLESAGARVATVEHLMAAFAGLGVDNASVDLTADEVPIMDGSSSPFVFLLQSAGLVEQPAPKQYLRVVHPVQVEDGEKWARFEPCEGFRVGFEIDFNHPAFRDQPRDATLDFAAASFVRDLSRARTFGFLADLERLREQGLARGGSFQNVVVVDDFRVLNEEGLRYQDEFVRHKMLDALGDIYLLGHSLIGAFHGFKSGHALNNRLVRKLLATPSAFECVTFSDSNEVPISYLEPLQAAG